jgi:hypothetical protein
MSEVYQSFALSQLAYDELPVHIRDRYALAAAMNAVADHLRDMGQGAAAATVRAILRNTHLQ